MGIGKLQTTRPIENAMKEIRDWLDKIGINGMSLDTKYDAKQNIALCRFTYMGKNYEFVSQAQKNCRLNMHGIARVIEYKVRAHLMDIEKFEKSMVAYLQLGASEEALKQGYVPTQTSSNNQLYAEFGISPLASNDELLVHYKKMAKTWHPDMAGSEEAKVIFEQKFSRLNEIWVQIKQERGLN